MLVTILSKHVVAGFAGQRRQPHKLQIGEPGFQNEIRADGELNRVLSQRQFIKEVREAIANQLLVW